MTLVLTTHYMEEAEQLCDRLVVMDRGHIIAHGSPQQLVEQYVTREVLELRFPPGQAPGMAPLVDGLAHRVEVLADRLLLYTEDGDALGDRLGHRGLQPSSSLVRRSSLEDVFMTLTGRGLTD